jgi:hypothetical protein
MAQWPCIEGLPIWRASIFLDVLATLRNKALTQFGRTGFSIHGRYATIGWFSPIDHHHPFLGHVRQCAIVCRRASVGQLAWQYEVTCMAILRHRPFPFRLD